MENSTYLTPQQIAQHIQDFRDETHEEIADHLGVDRSAVSQALREPTFRRIRILAKIAGFYGVDVDPERAAYPVEEESLKLPHERE